MNGNEQQEVATLPVVHAILNWQQHEDLNVLHLYEYREGGLPSFEEFLIIIIKEFLSSIPSTLNIGCLVEFTIPLKINPKVQTRLEVLAGPLGLKPEDVVRLAVANFLERNQDKIPLAKKYRRGQPDIFDG